MNCCWLITWTCYGHWLPGDARGFVGNVRETTGQQIVHNIPGTPYDADKPPLERWTQTQMRGIPITLGRPEAEALIAQFQETARIRRWVLQAAGVMYNHVHLVVTTPDIHDPKAVLKTFKSWATRAVKKLRTLPPNGTFWTVNGSKRKLPDDGAMRAAVIYVVKKQPHPLATWAASCWQNALDGWERDRDNA